VIEESPRKESGGKDTSPKTRGVITVDATIHTEDANPTSEEVAEEPESSHPDEDSLYHDLNKMFRSKGTPILKLKLQKLTMIAQKCPLPRRPSTLWYFFLYLLLHHFLI